MYIQNTYMQIYLSTIKHADADFSMYLLYICILNGRHCAMYIHNTYTRIYSN